MEDGGNIRLNGKVWCKCWVLCLVVLIGGVVIVKLVVEERV